MKSTELSKSNWKVRAFNFSNRAVRRLYSLILAIHQGFWLGVYNKHTVDQLVNETYIDWASYHEDEYLHSGLWPWEKSIIDQYFQDCRSLLIGAAGGGREILSLVKMGYQVDAFDCSSALAQTALELIKLENITCNYQVSEPDHVPHSLGQYDGLIMGWTGYSHIYGRQARIHFLKEFRQHIPQGRPLFISFFAHGKNSPMFNTIYYVAKTIRLFRLSSEKIEYGDTLVETYLRYFNQEEVEQELREGGFRMMFYSDRGFGHAVAQAL